MVEQLTTCILHTSCVIGSVVKVLGWPTLNGSPLLQHPWSSVTDIEFMDSANSSLYALHTSILKVWFYSLVYLTDSDKLIFIIELITVCYFAVGDRMF